MTNSILQIQRKDGKIYSPIRNKWLVETPEEKVRQEFVIVLVNQYGYNTAQLGEEEKTERGRGSSRADITIYKSKESKDKKEPPFIVIECKSDNVKVSERDYAQGESYARAMQAPFFVTHNSHETKYWKVLTDKIPGHLQEIEDIPKANATEKQIQEILKKLKVFKENEFADLLHACHNIIRDREAASADLAFDEIAKILFMKVYAERNLKAEMKENIFTLKWVEDAEKYTPDYLNVIFEKTKKDFGKDKIFLPDEKLKLKPATIKAIIQKLEVYNLSATSEDIKGIAFERFLGKTFRGDLGGFFTPRSIVEFMVQMIEPKEGEKACDPASGSGGFLIRFFEIVREQIHEDENKKYKKEVEKIEKQNLSDEEKAKLQTEAFERMQKALDKEIEDSRIWKLSHDYIFGTDKNERMARTSKMNMIMHGDGHGGIHHHDGFKNVNGIQDGVFDIILANPPFGATVREKDVLELYDLPKSKSIKTETLFIERCLNLLKNGGRMGIVLPEGIFNNPNALYVRQFAEDKAFLQAVISLPPETFNSAGASVKTSLLFLQKFTEEESKKWQEILQKRKEEVLAEQKDEREKLDKIIKDKKADKDEKKEARAKLKELNKQADEESRKRARANFDYTIFMAEAEKVGITATGETGNNVPNELPKILKQFKAFKKDPQKFVDNLKNEK